jgi:excisionase family DNA binding protein
MAEEPLLTPEEAALRLHVAPRTVREWLRQGKLRGLKVGRLLRVPESALHEFVRPAASLATDEALQILEDDLTPNP